MIFIVRICIVALASATLVLAPKSASFAILSALCLAVPGIIRARDAARGTALSPAVHWAALTTILGILSQILATFEPLSSGRPLSGLVTYMMTLSALASLTSVLNARTPGAGAWAILNIMLVVVFLIPLMEGTGLRGAGRSLTWLRLDNPWTIFFWLLVVAGVTNYLPTKYGLAAALLAIGFGLEYHGLTHPGLPRHERAVFWSMFPMTWATALIVADCSSRTASKAGTRLEAIWFLFRDHWGVVWALRVQERFNRSAESLGWPARLHWHGLLMSEDGAEWEPLAAESMLFGLLRRFVSQSRVEEALGTEAERSCRRPDVRR